jgi:hypothetical protein
MRASWKAVSILERPDFSVTFAAFCALPSSPLWRLLVQESVPSVIDDHFDRDTGIAELPNVRLC